MRVVVCDSSESKVEDGDFVGFFTQPDVGRFDVAMNQRVVVGRLQAGSDLRCDLTDGVFWQESDIRQPFFQRFAGNPLHGNQGQAVFFTDVVDRHNVRMFNRSRRLCLGHKPNPRLISQ